MTSDSKSQLNSPIYEQAADWLIELREGEVDADTRERLDAWFRESPQHIRAYLELSSIWEDGADPDLDRSHSTDELIAHARSVSNVISLNAAPLEAPGSANESSTGADRQSGCAQITDATNATQGSPETRAGQSLGNSSRDQRTRAHRFFRRSATAAAVVVCVLGGVGVYLYSQRNLAFTTDTGEQRFVKLVDGSTLELNSRSRVRIRFSDHERDVDLIEGQALFHVAKDSTRPFIVHSGSTSVRAVGTEFDVYRKASGTTVTVVEGRVAVLSPILAPVADADNQAGSAVPPQASKAGRSTRVQSAGSTVPPPIPVASVPGDPALSGVANAIFLIAGEQVTVSQKAVVRSTHTDTTVATAWTQHELIFDSTSLSDVAQEFNRYNTRQLIISDAALRDFHVTGVFSSADPASLLKFLRAQRDITVLESDEDVRISKK